MRRYFQAAALACFLMLPAAARGEDIFRFYAPPGSLALNASSAFGSQEYLSFTIEHEGAAISDWFVTLSRGQAPSFDPRVMSRGADRLNYQVTGEDPPSSKIIMDTSVSLTADHVISSSDFNAFAAALEQQGFDMVVHIPEGQFTTAGEYLDTVTLSLYTGTPELPGTHVLADTAMVAFCGRVARLLDIACEREAGITSLDLTADLVDHQIATVYETSNADPGYTVTVTSLNLAALSAGHSGPYFRHESGGSTLSYDLSYGGAAVSGWAGGSALVTDSAGITPAGGTPRIVTLTYSGDGSLSAGTYQDILTFTIAAK
jgi:spore coat protein U-like protein